MVAGYGERRAYGSWATRQKDAPAVRLRACPCQRFELLFSLARLAWRFRHAALPPETRFTGNSGIDPLPWPRLPCADGGGRLCPH